MHVVTRAPVERGQGSGLARYRSLPRDIATMLHGAALAAAHALILFGFATAVALGAAGQAAAQTPSRLPDFGLMLNDDGDGSFQDADPEKAVAMIREDMKQAAAAGVTTYVYCIGSGVLYYPTQVGSSPGWRTTAVDADPRWSFLAAARSGLARGADPIRAAAEAFRQPAPPRRYFVLSHRISDDHAMARPDASPLATRFMLDNRALLIGKGRSPVKAQPGYENLLDFSHAAVRDYNLRIMIEAFDRYRDVIDGFQIDFTRTPFLFPRGQGAAKKDVITDMVARLRAHVNQAAARDGKSYYLFVQVPPSLRNAGWAGLDVATWMRRGLIDVVTPSQLMTIAQDMPVAEFVEIARKAGVKVYPAIHSRRQIGWPLSEKPEADLRTPENARPETPFVVGAAANFAAQGADGVELYNWAARSWVRAPWFREMAGKLADRRFSAREKMTFAVSHAYYLDDDDSYEYRKPLPAALDRGKPGRFRLPVGAAIDCARVRCVLRIGMTDLDPSVAEIDVALNGETVARAPTQRLVKTSARPAQPNTQSARYGAPQAYLYLPLDTVRMPAGLSDVVVAVGGKASVAEISFGAFGPRD